MIKPLLFGYVRIVTVRGAAPADVGVLRTAMLRFATREGFTLSQVFVEAGTGPPWPALESLLAAGRDSGPWGVLVADRNHLGCTTGEQEATRGQIQATAGCPVITMRLLPSTTESAGH